MLISSARQKDKLLLLSQAFFCLNPVPSVYSTTQVEVLLTRIIVAYLIQDIEFLTYKPTPP